MSKTHFNPDTLCSTCHITSAKMCSCCRKPKRPQLTVWETGPPGGSAEDIIARKVTPQPAPPHTHAHKHTHIHTNAHSVWWQTTVTLSSSIAGRSCWTSDTSHTAQWASAPLVSCCRHRRTGRELLQLCRTNTEISLSKKHAAPSRKCLNIPQRAGLQFGLETHRSIE